MRINISIEEEVIKKFKKFAIDKGDNVSSRLQKLMEKDMEEYEKS